MKESIKNVLDMYKDGALSPEDAERLIEALWDGGENGPSVPWDNDNKLRVVAYRGRRLVKRGEAGDKLFELKLTDDVRDLECWGSVECGNILGDANAGGNMSVEESVGGSASSGGGMEIGGGVNGAASSGGGMTVRGSVSGPASSGGSMTVYGDVSGAVRAGARVSAKDIYGDVKADSVSCDGIWRRGEKKDGKEKDGRTWTESDPFEDEGFRQSIRTAESISGVDITSIVSGALETARNAVREARREAGRNGSGEEPETVTVEEDGDVEIVALQNGERITSWKNRALPSLRLEGSVENVSSEISVTVEGDVEGDVSVGDGGQIACGDVEGDVSIRGSGQITCDSVEGDVSAGGQIVCDLVEGNVQAGGDVHCDSVEGDVTANGNVECGDVGGNVSAGNDVTCGEIGGDVTSGGAIHTGE